MVPKEKKTRLYFPIAQYFRKVADRFFFGKIVLKCLLKERFYPEARLNLCLES